MATANFYLYDTRATKETRIILRFRYPAGNVSYSTRQKIHPKYWNKNKQRARISPSFPQGQSINKILNKLQSEVFRIYNDLIYQDLTPSNQILIEKLNEVLKIDSSRVKMSQINGKSFIELFELFIHETEHGIRVKKNGTKIRESTIKGYRTLLMHLRNFTKLKKFPLKILTIDSSSPTRINDIKDYYKQFYHQFTDYLYNDKNNYDNGVSGKIKNLRVFFSYLKNDKNINIGDFYKSMYVPNEDVPIITLSPEQLRMLIYDPSIDEKLCPRLQRIKDIFVFGCTVALRISDLLSLTTDNLQIVDDTYYLMTRSRKTDTVTFVKLPDFAKAIIDKYFGQYPTLLPSISDQKFNQYLKELGLILDFKNEVQKTRNKKGSAVNLHKDLDKQNNFLFADLMTSHMMRRTAI
jgi:integrase